MATGKLSRTKPAIHAASLLSACLCPLHADLLHQRELKYASAALQHHGQGGPGFACTHATVLAD